MPSLWERCAPVLRLIALPIGLLALLATVKCCERAAYARWKPEYAQQSPEVRQWFEGLHDKKGFMCCSNMDGVKLEDPDWEMSGNNYRVRIDGKWQDVPPDAVLDIPNRFGPAIVWRLNGKIRCFIAGAGT